MRERRRTLQIVLAPAADRDIRELLAWSEQSFGERAAGRYRDLLKRALKDIAIDPRRAGYQERNDLATGVCTYHISLSRRRAKNVVKHPRHFIVYRLPCPGVLHVVRILHDQRDLSRHIQLPDLE